MKKNRPLYLFMTKAGSVYVATDGSASVYEGPMETLIAHVRRTFNIVYMPGTACNMWLADAIYTVCGTSCVIRMLGPQYCNANEPDDDPNRILHNMRRCTASASAGGWIQVTPQVMPALRCCLDRSRVVGTSLHTQLPFWRDITFLDYVDPVKLVQLVAAIRDPRWFLTRDDSTSYRKLSLYLGLTPHNMAAAMCMEHSSQQVRRCHTALRTWQQGNEPPAGRLLASQFLWAVWRRYDNPVLANLRATQAFVTYLMRVWHMRLFTDGHPHAALLFDPGVYFTKEISEAYKSHLMAAG